MELTNCLTAGQTEIVYVAIGRRIDTLQECVPTPFTISVVPTVMLINKFSVVKMFFSITATGIQNIVHK